MEKGCDFQDTPRVLGGDRKGLCEAFAKALGARTFTRVVQMGSR